MTILRGTTLFDPAIAKPSHSHQ